jgi:hypothetical protein
MGVPIVGRFALSARVALAVTLCFVGSLAAGQPAEKPETVMLTYRAKQGSEAELIQTLAKHWQKACELKLVCETPHVVVRGTDYEDKPYLVEVLTWRDDRIPDAPPAAIQSIWAEMGNFVESRGGKPGIDIEVVSPIDVETKRTPIAGDELSRPEEAPSRKRAR